MQVPPLQLVDAALDLLDESGLPSQSRRVIRHVAKTHHDEGAVDGGLVYCSTRQTAKTLARTPELDRPPSHSTMWRRVPDLLARRVLIGGVLGRAYYLAVSAAFDEWQVPWVGGKHGALLELAAEARQLIDDGTLTRRRSHVALYGATSKVSTSRITRRFATWAATSDLLEAHGSQCFAGTDDSSCRGSCRETPPVSRHEAVSRRDTPPDSRHEAGRITGLSPASPLMVQEERERGASPEPQTDAIDLRPAREGPTDDQVHEATVAILDAIRDRGRSLRGRGLDQLVMSLTTQTQPINLEAALRAVRAGTDRMNGLDLADLAAHGATRPPAPPAAPRPTEPEEPPDPAADPAEVARAIAAARAIVRPPAPGPIASPVPVGDFEPQPRPGTRDPTTG